MEKHRDRMARLEELLAKLAEVRRQANDLGRKAHDLHREAEQSIKLVTQSSGDEATAEARSRTQGSKRRKRR
jgi:hypothetical protein